MNEIDFVILWVDGNDPAWHEEFVRTRQAENDDASEIRYRDWRNLHYWFRSAERFAPWVQKVHFITWGHLPAWLRRDHPKLHIVNHRDFIPAEYLPTFNSNTIELNIHRIEGLADRFVLFNDDTFLTRGCWPEDFFRRGVPCDMARLSVVQPSSVGHIIYNDLELINRLHVGDPVQVTVSAASEEPFEGVIHTVSPAAGQTGTYAIEVELDNPDGLLKSGMFAEVVFTGDRSENTVILPRSAVLSDTQGDYVFVENSGTVRRADVETGIDNGNEIEITSGLSEGDRVVVKGQEYLSDGTSVTVQEPEEE